MSDKHNRDPFANRYPRDDAEGDDESDGENDASTDEHRASATESETVQTPETTEELEASKMAETSDATEASEASETEEGSQSSESSGSSKTSKGEKTQEKSGGGVRERKNVNMYLPDALVEELQLRYAELNLEYRRERGEDMPKNQVFYPAVIKAALGESTVREMVDAIDDE